MVLIVVAAIAALVGHDLGNDAVPEPCKNGGIVDRGDVCTVPEFDGDLLDLPMWAAGELITLRARNRQLREEVEQLEAERLDRALRDARRP